MLVAGQLLHPAALEQLGERVEGERGDLRADRRLLAVERLELARLVVVVARPPDFRCCCQRSRAIVISMISEVPS